MEITYEIVCWSWNGPSVGYICYDWVELGMILLRDKKNTIEMLEIIAILPDFEDRTYDYWLISNNPYLLLYEWDIWIEWWWLGRWWCLGMIEVDICREIRWADDRGMFDW